MKISFTFTTLLLQCLIIYFILWLTYINSKLLICTMSLLCFINLDILGREGGSYKAIEEELNVQGKPNAKLLP